MMTYLPVITLIFMLTNYLFPKFFPKIGKWLLKNKIATSLGAINIVLIVFIAYKLL
ncbi:hypothetical protein [Bacillus cereus]|uniref:hypothetical protein n=1 Tax=Bacillus cereus TaxID=1396 RepID=UPI0015915E7C|nr:hypothetical protein [Bacillus cereus]